MKTRCLLGLFLLVLLFVGCNDAAETPTPTPTEAPPTAAVSEAATGTATMPPEPVASLTPTAKPEPTATATPEPAVLAYEPFFTEVSCHFALPPNETEGETILCGTVTVPEERSQPDGDTINLAVVVFKALSEEPQPDPVILLAGGPGEKVVASALDVSLILAQFRDERDLIVFDQRGVGLSEPALECPEYVEAMFASLDELDPETDVRIQFDALMACRDRLVAEGANLSAYNTTENASDVDDIRRALGYEQLNLYGGSYGTLLAQAVMRNHPEGLRSVVLGAVLPADTSFFVEVPNTIVAATLHLLETCAADAACDAAYPQLKQTLFDTIDQLNAEPVPIEVTNPRDGQTYDTWLTGDAIFGNLVLFLYITDIIPVLPQAIDDVANGDYELMTQLTSTSLSLFDALSRGMEFSVFCAEDLIGVSPAEFLEYRLQMPPQLAGRGDPEDLIEYGFFGICENWPVAEADPSVKDPVVSDIPTLILEGEFDPVTPMAFAEEVARHLSNSYLYLFPGVGHNILLGSPCARDIANQFLADPASEPDAGCIDEMPGVIFDLPQEERGEIVLEPFTYELSGMRGLGPAGWESPVPGTFVRGQNALDSTALIMGAQPMNHDEFMALITARLGLDAPPGSVGERETEALTWTLYEVEVQGIAVDLATAVWDEETTWMALMQSPPDERERLYQVLFLAAVDALAPLE
jgi:pimeloyl-ACP methyl ester carboxylesterase